MRRPRCTRRSRMPATSRARSSRRCASWVRACRAIPTATCCPGVEVSTGSLGQGLSIAAGMAAGLKLGGQAPARILPARRRRVRGGPGLGGRHVGRPSQNLDNLVAIVDRNHLQIDGDTADVCDPGDMCAKFSAFGWEASHVDGHDIDALIKAAQRRQARRATAARMFSSPTPSRAAACRSWKTRPVGTARRPTPSRPSRLWPSSRPHVKEA